MYSTQKWYCLIQEWEQSNQTQSEFCDQRGLVLGQFKAQRKKGLACGKFSKHRVGGFRGNKPSVFTPIDVVLPADANGAVHETTSKPIAPPVERSNDIASMPKSESPDMIEIALPHGISLRIPC